MKKGQWNEVRRGEWANLEGLHFADGAALLVAILVKGKETLLLHKPLHSLRVRKHDFYLNSIVLTHLHNNNIGKATGYSTREQGVCNLHALCLECGYQ